MASSCWPVLVFVRLLVGIIAVRRLDLRRRLFPALLFRALLALGVTRSLRLLALLCRSGLGLITLLLSGLVGLDSLLLCGVGLLVLQILLALSRCGLCRGARLVPASIRSSTVGGCLLLACSIRLLALGLGCGLRLFVRGAAGCETLSTRGVGSLVARLGVGRMFRDVGSVGGLTLLALRGSRLLASRHRLLVLCRKAVLCFGPGVGCGLLLTVRRLRRADARVVGSLASPGRALAVDRGLPALCLGGGLHLRYLHRSSRSLPGVLRPTLGSSLLIAEMLTVARAVVVLKSHVATVIPTVVPACNVTVLTVRADSVITTVPVIVAARGVAAPVGVTVLAEHDGCDAGTGGCGIGSSTIALGLPLAAIVLIGVIGGLPCGVARPGLIPGLPTLDLGTLTLLPFGGICGLATLVLRSAVECPGTVEIARRGIGAPAGIDIVEQGTVGPVDTDQLAAVIGIAAIGIADIERLVGARLVVIVALASGQALDDAIGTVVGAPHPRSCALIVDGVVGGRVAERRADSIGAVGIAVAFGARLGGDPDGS